MSKIDLISNEWTDLVFEGRNQSYGAYKLRKGTGKRNVWALVIVGLAAALLYLGLQLQRMAEANKKVENTQAVELAKLNTEKKEAKVEKKEIIKQEPEKVVEQVKSSVKFTAPVIKKDEEVKEEDEIKLDEVQKSDKAVGAFTVEGNDEVGGAVLKAKEEIASLRSTLRSIRSSPWLSRCLCSLVAMERLWATSQAISTIRQWLPRTAFRVV